MDGTVLRFGQLRGPRAMIDQVKGFSYPASSLLGANTSLHKVVNEDMLEESSEQSTSEDSSKHSWWRISLASPKVRNPISAWYTDVITFLIISNETSVPVMLLRITIYCLNEFYDISTFMWLLCLLPYEN